MPRHVDLPLLPRRQVSTIECIAPNESSYDESNCAYNLESSDRFEGRSAEEQ
jgi:hypothetical protein